jgi:hypothetical protein
VKWAGSEVSIQPLDRACCGPGFGNLKRMLRGGGVLLPVLVIAASMVTRDARVMINTLAEPEALLVVDGMCICTPGHDQR